MKQFWTPLASLMRLVGKEPEPRTDPPRHPAPRGGQALPDWEPLRAALKRYGEEELLAMCRRHAALAPDERFILRKLRLRATTPGMAALLRQWHAETSEHNLARWVAQAAWQHPELAACLDTSESWRVEVSDPGPDAPRPPGRDPYLDHEGHASGASEAVESGLVVDVEGCWSVARERAIDRGSRVASRDREPARLAGGRARFSRVADRA